MVEQTIGGEVARAAAVLGATAPFPMVDGEPVFAEPWEGRAFAMAVDVVSRCGLPWEAFRSRLVAAIAADPHRPYYESWVVALEELVVATGAVSDAELADRRQDVATYRYHDAALGDVEVVPVRLDSAELRAILDTIAVAGATAGRVDLADVRHAERYRPAAGEWRFRLFDATDTVVLDVPLPPPGLIPPEC